MISAKIITDSLNTQGQRLTTFVLVFPRIVLAEFNTHRMISRNSASSRAIPFETMVKKVHYEPFVPIAWQKEHPGMQGTAYFTESTDIKLRKEAWMLARESAIKQAIVLHDLGVTKQLCNRLLEPFLYHTVICTGTDWENFFALRAHEAAEIHIQDLAYKMLKAYNKSIPNLLQPGEWHIPFGDQIEASRIPGFNDTHYVGWLDEQKRKIATARCARISYNTFEGKDDYEADIKLHDRLASSGHWSPFEHCAKVMSEDDMLYWIRTNVNFNTNASGMSMDEMRSHNCGWCGNFKGFIQYRKTFERENRQDARVIKNKLDHDTECTTINAANTEQQQKAGTV